MEVKSLYIYPIKSCRQLAVEEVTVTQNGLQYDRQYLIIRIHPNGRIEHLTIKTMAELCLFQPVMNADKESFTVHYCPDPCPREEGLVLPFNPHLPADTQKYPIEIFETRTTGLDMGEKPAEYFSKHLQLTNVRLLYIGVNNTRDPFPAVTPRVSSTFSAFGLAHKPKHPQKISYADMAPILITTTSSLQDVSSRLPPDEGGAPGKMDITKFRPNIHIRTPESTEPYEEEFWSSVRIGDNHIEMKCTYNTARCISLNVDYRTGTYHKEPEWQVYKLLLKDRRINPLYGFKPCFGKYAFCENMGAKVRVGDRVEVTGRNGERHVPVE